MLPSVGIYICCLDQVCLTTQSSMNIAGVLQRVASVLHRASVASAVVNMDKVGMLQRAVSNAAEKSVIDSACINQSYRACILSRVGFHAADTANMLNSAGSNSAKVWDSAGLHAGRCKSVTLLELLSSSLGPTLWLVWTLTSHSPTSLRGRPPFWQDLLQPL